MPLSLDVPETEAAAALLSWSPGHVPRGARTGAAARLGSRLSLPASSSFRSTKIAAVSPPGLPVKRGEVAPELYPAEEAAAATSRSLALAVRDRDPLSALTRACQGYTKIEMRARRGGGGGERAQSMIAEPSGSFDFFICSGCCLEATKSLPYAWTRHNLASAASARNATFLIKTIRWLRNLVGRTAGRDHYFRGKTKDRINLSASSAKHIEISPAQRR